MIVRTDAIVLRSMEYGETSRIVTLFTREKGRLAVLAKGARLPKSRFGSSLQPLSYAQVVFYYKQTRGLQTLSESAHVEVFHDIGRSLEKLALGLRMVELVQGLMPDEEPNPSIFNLLAQTLRHLNAAEARAPNLLPFFQLRLAAILGFAPNIDRDAVQALPDSGGFLDLDSGAVQASPLLGGTSRRASRTVLRAFAVFARAELDAVLRMRLTPGVFHGVDALVDAYLRHHVHEAYPSRGSQVVSELLQPGASGM